MNIKVSYYNRDIARVIINEPKTYNSLSTKNLNDLIKVFKKLDKDQKIKVIILEGAGKGFSAGHNLKEVKSLKGKSNYNKLFDLCFGASKIKKIFNGFLGFTIYIYIYDYSLLYKKRILERRPLNY